MAKRDYYEVLGLSKGVGKGHQKGLSTPGYEAPP